jgi:hypothetical protein
VIRDRVLELANELGYVITSAKGTVYIEKQNKIFITRSYEKAYHFLYNRRRAQAKN